MAMYAMYSCVWLCMAVYGYVWLCMAMYGCVWLCMAVYGYVCLCMAMYGCVYIVWLSFDYCCCYTGHKAVKILQFLESYFWTPHEVKFDKMGCVIICYDDFVALTCFWLTRNHKMI